VLTLPPLATIATKCTQVPPPFDVTFAAVIPLNVAMLSSAIPLIVAIFGIIVP
jgi:hypothetical protein